MRNEAQKAFRTSRRAVALAMAAVLCLSTLVTAACRGCRIYKTETGGEEKDVVLQQKVKEDIHSEGEV